MYFALLSTDYLSVLSPIQQVAKWDDGQPIGCDIIAGFLRFDPAMVQFMEVLEVPLRPEAAAVGLEVRVVGNDSGEKARCRCLTCP